MPNKVPPLKDHYLIRPFTLIVLILTWAATGNANPSMLPDWNNVTQLFQQEQWEQVISVLSPVVSDPKSTAPLSYKRKSWFLIGKSYFHQQKYQEAEFHFYKGQTLDPVDKDIWQYHRAKNFLAWGKYDQVSLLYPLLLIPSLTTFYMERIREDLMTTIQTPENAAKIFPFLHSTLNHPSLLLQDYKIADLYIQGATFLQQKIPPDLYIFQWKNPMDKETALSSEKNVLSLIQQGLIFPRAKDYIKRFQTLEHFNLNGLIVKTIPEQIHRVVSPKYKAKLGHLYARNLFAEKAYSMIVKLKQNGVFSEEYHLLKTEQMFWIARSYQRLGQLNEALEAIHQLEKLNPRSPLLPELYYKMARNFMGTASESEALYWLKLIVKEFQGHKLREVALWELAKLRYNQKRYSDALFHLDNGLKQELSSPEVRAKFLYWHGKISHLLKNKIQAQKSFLALRTSYPNTYYGLYLENAEDTWKAYLDTPVPQSKPTWHDNPPEPTPLISNVLERPEFLISIGEGTQAGKDLQSLIQKTPKYAMIWSGSELLLAARQYRALQVITASFYLWDLKRLPVQNQRTWNFAYPKAYWEVVQPAAEKAKISPFLALAIMREESHFRTEALSTTNAMGLMQLMPNTAKQVARRHHIPLNDPKEAAEIELNIRLGVYYLGHLSKQFHHQLIPIIGSYNAGPGNIKKWLEKYKIEHQDEFVESIPFQETQDYIKRVYTSYQLYKKIYKSLNSR
ncbi:transglycosylase SLT domain-containing protein [Deltaproteobacteria bacterium TL4]